MVRTAAADAHGAFRSRSSLPTIQAALLELQPRSTGSPAPLQVAPPSQTTIEAPPSKSVRFSLETPAAVMAAALCAPSYECSSLPSRSQASGLQQSPGRAGCAEQCFAMTG